jgi:hypothetical protein
MIRPVIFSPDDRSYGQDQSEETIQDDSELQIGYLNDNLQNAVTISAVPMPLRSRHLMTTISIVSAAPHMAGPTKTMKTDTKDYVWPRRFRVN